jgi:type II secretory pathway pseudopilin PulG
MSSQPYSRNSPRADAPGFTLIELLVGLLLSTALLALLARDFGFTARIKNEMEDLLETQQGVRAALSALTQELRQAGACLPRTGNLVALSGTDNGTEDTLTIRIGKTMSDLTCVRTVTTSTAGGGQSYILVQSTSGFKAGDWVYLRDSTGAGDSFTLASIGTNRLNLSGSLGRSYPSGSGVYAVEERRYAISNTIGRPVLTVTIDGGAAQPMVDNVEAFNVRYVTTPCPPCDELDAPDSDDWALVREVNVSVTVRSAYKNRAGQYVRLSDQTNVKPRNLI